MRVVLILFSFLYLFATEANVKYVSKNSSLYIYIQSKEYPKNYSIPNVTIENGNIRFLGNFNYFYNGEYYVGKKYYVEFKNYLQILPLKITYNSKTYFTNSLTYKKSTINPPEINISVKTQKSYFFNILIYAVLIYLITLIVVYNAKAYKLKKKMGYYKEDIKKLYYYLALQGHEEVEILNKKKNIFKKSYLLVEHIPIIVIRKELGFDRYYKEFKLFFVILILLSIIKAFVWTYYTRKFWF